MSDELGRWVCLFLLLCSQLVASTAKNSAGAVGPILKPLHRPFGPCKFSYCSASQDEIADHIGPPSASNVYARVLWQECSAGGVFFFSPLKVDSDPTFKCAKGTGLAIKGAFCHRPCEAYTNAGSIRLAKLENIQERGVPSLGVVATRDGQWVAPKFDGGPYKLAHYDRIHGACQFSYCSAILEEASNHRGPPPKTNRALARVFRECFTINTKWEKGPINIYDIGQLFCTVRSIY